MVICPFHRGKYKFIIKCLDGEQAVSYTTWVVMAITIQHVYFNIKVGLTPLMYSTLHNE